MMSNAPHRNLFAILAIGCLPFATATPVKAEVKIPAIGEAAPDFRLPTLQGEAVQLSKLIGDGPVVLIVLRGYPGYQCPICNVQVGQLLTNAAKLSAKKARVVLVYPGVAEGLAEHAADFARGKTLPDNFYLIVDPNFVLTEAYALRWNAPRETAYPSTFVIDGKGKVRFAKVSMSHGGRASVDEVLRALE